MSAGRAGRLLAWLFLTVLLCGCGGEKTPAEPEYPWAAEDAEIRAAMGDPDFGRGVKLAVFDVEKGRYSYHGAYLPDDLRAADPGEIGAFVRYDSQSVMLQSAMDRRQGYWHEFNQPQDIAEIKGRTGVIIDDPLRDPEHRASTLDDYLRLYVPLMFRGDRQTRLLNALNAPQSGVKFTGGTKFVGYDESTGRYTMDRIPEALQAETLEETGYILSYHTDWEERTIEFGKKGPVDVRFEQFSARLIVAETGEELESFQLGATVPAVMTFVNGKAANQTVSAEEIKSKLKSIMYFQRGMEWPFD